MVMSVITKRLLPCTVAIHLDESSLSFKTELS